MRWLREQVQKRPAQSFLNGYSYKQIYEQAVLNVGFLEGAIQSRKRIGVCSENSVSMAILLFALWLMGKEVFLVNPQLTVEERMTQAVELGVDLVFTSPAVQGRIVAEQEAADSEQLQLGKAKMCSLAGCVSSAMAQIRLDDGTREHIVQWQTMPVLPLMDEQTTQRLVALFEQLLPQTEAGIKTVITEPKSAGIAAIMTTSATTGKVKAVPLGWKQIEAHVKASAQVLGVSPDDNWLIVLPMFHVSGLSILLRTLYNGTAATIHSGFDEAAVLTAISSGKINMVSLVPTVLQRLVPYIENNKLRVILLGGEFIPNALVEACLAKALPIFKTYGMTETFAQSTTVDLLTHPDKWQSVGKPLPGVTIEIRSLGSSNENRQSEFQNQVFDVDSQADQFAPGQSVDEESQNYRAGKALYEGAVDKDHADEDMHQIGEVWIKSPMVMNGYLGQRPIEGFFNTDDMGYVDEDGYLYIVNRRKDIIISGGENIYPKEIEDVLYNLADVKECAVVPKADAKWGQVPVLYYAGTASESSVAAHLKQHLGRYKQPKEIHKLEALPRNSSGKILRRALV